MSAKAQTKQPAAEKPALHVRVGGVRIPIWKNEGEDKIHFKAGIPELSYKGRDGNWKTSKSYSAHDLVNLIKAAALAHSEIIQRDRAEFASQETADEDDDG